MSDQLSVRQVTIERVQGGVLVRVDPDTADVGLLAAACENAASQLRLIAEEGMAAGGHRLTLELPKPVAREVILNAAQETRRVQSQSAKNRSQGRSQYGPRGRDSRRQFPPRQRGR